MDDVPQADGPADERSHKPNLSDRLKVVQTAPLSNAAMTGAIIALVLATLLARLNTFTLVALIWTSVSLVLFAVAGYDLVVRWADVDLDRPDAPMTEFERRASFLLRAAAPEALLVAGILAGHYLWP
jgi:hypothetical protein